MRKLNFLLYMLIPLTLSLNSFAQDLDMSKLKDLKPRNIGPAGMSGRVTAIDVILNNPEIIYIGTASGGVWKSESEGVDWKPVFDKEKVLSIGAIAIDQNTPDIVWAGTGEGNPRNSNSGGYGIYKSIDAGKTWKLMGLEETRHIHRIIIDPTNSDVVYVGAIGSPWGSQQERGVYKTTDGGKTWKNILFTNDLSGVGEMIMDPSNHNKLFVNMWEHKRWPWFFKSGGEGSGLYYTLDGGDNWTKLTEKEGMPKGELGRMGLAISKSNPEVVYALIESKKNAFYRSDDGGYNWKKTTDKNIGDRPFYYAEIYVDPLNENRVYTLYSRVNISEDGGKTFSQFMGWTIHPDHHAWWIHPDNPKYMINGNDGGLAITKDHGKSWRFVENLPLGQFYHIRVDNELPYNVYGGLQDNGSWRGPAYTWTNGGIINTYWEQLGGGDGFDAMPDKSDPGYCYAQSQQGYLDRVDISTGYSKSIRPVHPQGEFLRFNWNAAIAADPFDDKTIYFGSQYLHKSTDRGESWEIISPDLTSNDPEKQKQLESGGLTYDATGAENYTTILAIDPSPITKGLIWLSTDDGNIQITRDGGKTWTNTSKSLKGVPEGSWIPQIHASKYNEGEAFAVINNYRRHDYAPYLYHTKNYGKSWESMLDKDEVWGYVLSFIQDPVEPRLMFLGTENGLYISIDAGNKWTLWKEGFPQVSTMDLVIHPREQDLIIGTFGRSVWILDDIRPLREIAAKGTGLLDEAIHIFEPPVAYMATAKPEPGYYSKSGSYYRGENRKTGAMISFSVKEGNADAGKQQRERPMMSAYGGNRSDNSSGPKGDKAKVEIIDNGGNTVRTLSVLPKTGVNRIYWRFDRKGFRWPGQAVPKADSEERGGGGYAFPGEYTVRITYKDQCDSIKLNIVADPRLPYSLEGMKKNKEKMAGIIDKLELLTKAYDRVKESKETIAAIKKLTPDKDDEATKQLKESTKKIEEALKDMTKNMYNDETKQGIYRNPEVITSKIRSIRGAMYSIEEFNATELLQLDQAEEVIDKTLAKVNAFYNEPWAEFRKTVEQAKLKLFKDYESLE